jgi:chlorophyll(ide) b reductase
VLVGTPAAAQRGMVLPAAEDAPDVAQFLVPRIRAVPSTSINPFTGAISPAYIRFLTKAKAYSQIFKRLLRG